MNAIKEQIQKIYRERAEMLRKVNHQIVYSTPEERANTSYYKLYEEQRQLQESVDELADILEQMGE